MSGYLALLNLDERPISHELIRHLTDSLGFRGPDAGNIKIDGFAGFGHALLRTTFESRHERQPLTLDGHVWIVADARIDGREDLVGRFPAEDRARLITAPDAELILRSYLKWGDECLEHLIGDFSFAIWDGSDRKLFCARDHFGVKPLYYSRTKYHLIVSNTIACIRRHPEVSKELNDQAVGDYLLFGSNEHPETTFYSDIRRLPAAHKLTHKNSDLNVSRFWTLPIQDELHYNRQSDYVENFNELLDSAVNDRLRTDKVAIFMSGGIDSPTIAATARDLLAQSYSNFNLKAFTAVCDRVIPDQERYYSGLVAEKLGIPIHYLVCDDFQLFEGWDYPELKTPEPTYEPYSIISFTQYRQVSSKYRIVLTGQGGDVILRPSFSHIINQLKKFQFVRAADQITRHVFQHRRLPRIGFRTRLRKIFGKNPWIDYYPSWLNKDFENRLNLRSRWEELTSQAPSIHPYRPESYRLITSIFWGNLFESCDPGNTNFPFEQRHPLFDVRLVDYSMRIPSLPWCVDKKLMRECMKGRLPDQVLKRDKTPLADYPTIEKMKKRIVYPAFSSNSSDQINRYVDWNSISSDIMDESSLTRVSSDLLPISLNYWLHNSYLNSI